MCVVNTSPPADTRSVKWVLILGWSLLVCPAHGDEWKLPVVTLRYETAAGVEEEEEEGTLSAAYWRHSVAIRVKEERGGSFRATVTGRLSWKDFTADDVDDYWYVGVVPGLEWSLGRVLGVGAEFSVKRALFGSDPASPDGRDYLDLGPKLFADWTIVPGLKLDAWLRSTYSLYEDETNSRQAYSFGAGLTGRRGQWSVGARYRGTGRYPLGEASGREFGGYHVGSLNVSWDPNR